MPPGRRPWIQSPGPSAGSASARDCAAVRFVYSPRTGWGYSRLPLIVVSVQGGLDVLGDPYATKSRSQVDIIHEMAHFWLTIADRVVETLSGSPDREINRYTKPALMLVEAEEQHGWPAMRDFLRALMTRARSQDSGLITTEDFLTISRETLGQAARDEFAGRLSTEGW